MSHTHSLTQNITFSFVATFDTFMIVRVSPVTVGVLNIKWFKRAELLWMLSSLFSRIWEGERFVRSAMWILNYIWRKVSMIFNIYGESVWMHKYTCKIMASPLVSEGAFYLCGCVFTKITLKQFHWIKEAFLKSTAFFIYPFRRYFDSYKQKHSEYLYIVVHYI